MLLQRTDWDLVFALSTVLAQLEITLVDIVKKVALAGLFIYSLSDVRSIASIDIVICLIVSFNLDFSFLLHTFLWNNSNEGAKSGYQDYSNKT